MNNYDIEIKECLGDPMLKHSVPDCALFAKNSPQDYFLRFRPSQVRVITLTTKNKRNQPSG